MGMRPSGKGVHLAVVDFIYICELVVKNKLISAKTKQWSEWNMLFLKKYIHKDYL